MAGRDRALALRNIFFSSMSSYIEYGIFLAAGVLIARSLEPSVYGVYAYSVWLGGLLVIICNHGLTITAIRFCAEARGKGQDKEAMQIASLINGWHTVSCLAAFGLFALIIWLVPPKEWLTDLPLYIILTIAGTLGRATCLIKTSIGKGFEEFAIGNYSSIAGSVLSLVLVLALMAVNASVLQYFIAFSFVGLVTGAVATFALRRHGVLKASGKDVDVQTRKRIIRSILWTAAIMIVTTMGYRTFETLALKTFWTTELVGYFAISGLIAKGVSDLLAGGFDRVLLPMLTRKMQSADSKTTGFFVSEAARYYFFLGMCIAGAGYVSVEGAITILYGTKYTGAGFAVMISLIVAGLGLMASAFNAFQISSDNQVDRVKAALCALVVSAAASYLFIPKLGLLGALLSVSLTTVVSLALAIFQVGKTVMFKFPFRPVIATLIACIGSALVGRFVTDWVGGKFGFVFGGIAFGVLFLTASVLTRSWANADFDMAIRLLSKYSKTSGLVPALTAMKKHFSFDERKSAA
jgi:O-antigen/teichoic acid export membrane protein